MTVEEFLKQIGWNRVFYNKEINEYEIVKEEYNEAYETYGIIKDLQIKINHKTKQIIILD